MGESGQPKVDYFFFNLSAFTNQAMPRITRAARIAISPIKIISRVDEEILKCCFSHTSKLRHLSSLINV